MTVTEFPGDTTNASCRKLHAQIAQDIGEANAMVTLVMHNKSGMKLICNDTLSIEGAIAMVQWANAQLVKALDAVDGDGAA